MPLNGSCGLIAAGDDDCQEVIDWLSQVNFYPLATCTVLQELADMAKPRRKLVSSAAKRFWFSMVYLTARMSFKFSAFLVRIPAHPGTSPICSP